MLENLDLDHGEQLTPLFSAFPHPLFSQLALRIREMRIVTLARIADPTMLRSHRSILKHR